MHFLEKMQSCKFQISTEISLGLYTTELMLRVIHISDFHLESENPTYHKLNLTNAFIADLDNYVNEQTIICLTGDLLDKGGLTFKDKINSYTYFEDFLIEPIRKKYPNVPIFFVPGNHDCNREKVNKFLDKGLRDELKSINDVNSFISNYSSEIKYFERLENYKNFEKGYLEKSFKEHKFSYLESSIKITISGKKIGISCLNSSWLCKDDGDQGNLIVGQLQVTRSLEYLKDCEIKIALVHHPFEFLTEFDKKDIKNIISKHYQMVLCGHVHELDTYLIQNPIGNIFESIANATIGDNPSSRDNVNGYSIIDYNPSQGWEIVYRKYLEKHEKFVLNTDVGNDTAKWVVKLPTDETASDIYRKFMRLSVHENLSALTMMYMENESLLLKIRNKTFNAFDIERYLVRVQNNLNQQKYRLLDFELEGNFPDKRDIFLNQITSDICQLIYWVRDIFEEHFRYKNLFLKLDLPKSLKIKADQNRISQVFINLFKNAIQYSPVRGTIAISYKEIVISSKKLHEITFSNESAELSPEECDNIFQLYFRGKNAIKTQVVGRGLGLFIVKKIIEAHNGECIVSINKSLFKISIRLPKTESDEQNIDN